jgi:hypothetical protein
MDGHELLIPRNRRVKHQQSKQSLSSVVHGSLRHFSVLPRKVDSSPSANPNMDGHSGVEADGFASQLRRLLHGIAAGDVGAWSVAVRCRISSSTPGKLKIMKPDKRKTGIAKRFIRCGFQVVCSHICRRHTAPRSGIGKRLQLWGRCHDR